MPTRKTLAEVLRSLEDEIAATTDPLLRERRQFFRAEIIQWVEDQQDALTLSVDRETRYLQDHLDAQSRQLAEVLDEVRKFSHSTPRLVSQMEALDAKMDAIQEGFSQLLDRVSKNERNLTEHERRIADLHNRTSKLEAQESAIQAALDEVARLRKTVADILVSLDQEPHP